MNLADPGQFDDTAQGLAWVFANPIVLLIILVVLWLLSLRIWPEKMCPRCQGAGYKNGLIGVRRCGKCGGAGLVPRFGSRSDE